MTITHPAPAQPPAASPGVPALLEARGVGRRIGQAQILHDVDLAVAPGEFLAITGPSGCGKSTLLYTLCGLEPSSSGTVLWAGEDRSGDSAADLSRHRLLEVGIVFQQFHLLRHLTLLDNVVLPGLLARVEKRSAVIARGRELLDGFGVGELADRSVGEASGGQLQRVALVRALINGPRLLVADEPTGALDSAATAGVMEALERIGAEGTTIVMVTHDPEVADRADRVVTMSDGRIVGERPGAGGRTRR